MMSEGKTYVFGNDANASNMMGMIAPLLQQRGLDPNMVMAMMNNKDGFGGNSGWWWVIFLFFLMGWGNNGWGGNRNGNGLDGLAGANLANVINNDSYRELFMQAINGNQTAINQLANNLNCSINQVQQAINSVATGMERGFSSVAYETQRQTCDITNAISNSTSQILAGQKAAEMRELTRDLAERDRKISEQAVIINNAQQTSIFSQMIQQATIPIANALNGLQKDVDGIKCRLPETANIPYSPVVGVPTCVAAQYGLGLGLGLNYGINGIWG